MARACSFTATLAGLSTQILLAVCVHYSTKAFGENRGADVTERAGVGVVE